MKHGFQLYITLILLTNNYVVMCVSYVIASIINAEIRRSRHSTGVYLYTHTHTPVRNVQRNCTRLLARGDVCIQRVFSDPHHYALE